LRLHGTNRILALLAALALSACSSPSAARLAETIRSEGAGIVADAAVRSGDLSDDWVEVTFRPAVTADQMHDLWCRSIEPNGGVGAYDNGSEGILVQTLDSNGQEVFVPIKCP